MQRHTNSRATQIVARTPSRKLVACQRARPALRELHHDGQCADRERRGERHREHAAAARCATRHDLAANLSIRLAGVRDYQTHEPAAGLSGLARGVSAALAFSIVNRFCVAVLYGRARRLTSQNGSFRPRQWGPRSKRLALVSIPLTERPQMRCGNSAGSA